MTQPGTHRAGGADTTMLHAPHSTQQRVVPLHAGTRISLKRDRTTTFATLSVEEAAIGGGGGAEKAAGAAGEKLTKQPRTTHALDVTTPPTASVKCEPAEVSPRQPAGAKAEAATPFAPEEKSGHTLATLANAPSPSYLYSLAGEVLYGALPLCVISLECNILDCNASFLSLFGGYTRRDMLERSLFQLTHQSEIRDVFSMMERLIEVATKPATTSPTKAKDARSASLPIATSATASTTTATIPADASPSTLHTFERTCVLSDGRTRKLMWTIWLTRQQQPGAKPIFLCTMAPSPSGVPTSAVSSPALTTGRALNSPQTPSSTPSGAFTRPAAPQARKFSTPLTSSAPALSPSVSVGVSPAASAAMSALSVLSEVALPTPGAELLSSSSHEQQLQQQQQAQAQAHAHAAAQAQAQAAHAAAANYSAYGMSAGPYGAYPPQAFGPPAPMMFSPAMAAQQAQIQAQQAQARYQMQMHQHQLYAQHAVMYSPPMPTTPYLPQQQKPLTFTPPSPGQPASHSVMAATMSALAQTPILSPIKSQ